MPSKEGLCEIKFKKADIEYPFEQIQASFLTQLPERMETTQGFHHEANSYFKTVKTEFNGCDMRI